MTTSIQSLTLDDLILAVIAVAVFTTSIGVAALLIARSFSHDAIRRYFVLLLALISMLLSPIAFVASRSLEIDLFSVSLPRITSPHSRQATSNVSPNHSASTNNESPIVSPESMQLPLGQPTSKAASSVISEPQFTRTIEPALSSRSTPRFAAGAVTIWLAVSLLLTLRLIIGWCKLRRIRRCALPVSDPEFREVYASLRNSIGRELPKVFESEYVYSPIAAGISRTVVILPKGFCQKLNRSQMDDVLLHEFAHIVRRDHWVLLIQQFARILLWPQPLLHILNRQIEIAREEVCDNYVLASTDAVAYGRTLLHIAELIPTHGSLLGTIGLYSSKWNLEDRISGLLNERRVRMTRTNKTWATILIAVMAVILVVPLATKVSFAEGQTTTTASDEKTVPPAVPQQRDQLFKRAVVERDGCIAGSIWSGQIRNAIGKEHYPLVLYITERQGSTFKGAIWLPAAGDIESDRTSKCSGIIGSTGTITFTEYGAVQGRDRITNHISYAGNVEGNSLRGNWWTTDPKSGETSGSKLSLNLANEKIVESHSGKGSPLPIVKPPTTEAVLTALSNSQTDGIAFLTATKRKNARIVVEQIVDRIEEPRVYPGIGPARLRHCRFKCTVYSDKEISSVWPIPFTHNEAATEVVFIDDDQIIR